MGNILLTTFLSEGLLAAGGLRGLTDKFFSDWIMPAAALIGFIIIVGVALFTRQARVIAVTIVLVVVAFIAAFMVKSAAGNDGGKFKSTGEEWGNALGVVVAPQTPGVHG
jgi:hypothetical protein